MVYALRKVTIAALFSRVALVEANDESVLI